MSVLSVHHHGLWLNGDNNMVSHSITIQPADKEVVNNSTTTSIFNARLVHSWAREMTGELDSWVGDFRQVVIWIYIMHTEHMA